jgi:hypothetical protein
MEKLDSGSLPGMTEALGRARLVAEPYTASVAAEWDALVERAPMGTFLHTRRFLSYHGGRFQDASVVVRRGDGRLLGVVPAAIDPAAEDTIVSHPGATFGGVVHAGSLAGGAMVGALEAVRRHYATAGYKTLLYKAVPWIYHRQPAEDDAYALARLGASCVRRDLSCCVDLGTQRRTSERRRRGRTRAEAAGITIVAGTDIARRLWGVVEDNLERKYSVAPVHTVDEILLLNNLFPGRIKFVGAALGDEVVAGVVLFVNPRIVHAQYIAASENGKRANALDLVFDYCIREAIATGHARFNFGISDFQDGRLNDSLYEFKRGFGGGGVTHDWYELEL